jgi:hypothetical protein
MLISYFRQSYLPQYVVFILLTLVLWLGAFISYTTSPISFDPLLSPGYSALTYVLGENHFLLVSMALVFNIFSAVLFNYTLTKFDLAPKNTLVPAMVFMILISLNPKLLYFHPTTLPTLFIVLALFYLFQVYTTEEAFPQIFNIGLLIGVSSFFYFPSFLLILFVWLTFIVYRLYKWREWLIPVSGMLTPYIFLFTYYFMMDQLEPAYLSYSQFFGDIDLLRIAAYYSIFDYIIFGFVSLLFLWSLFVLLTNIQEKIISLRKRYWAVFWLFIIALISIPFSAGFFDFHLIYLLIPMSVLITYNLSKIKRMIWIEVIWSILLILIIINNLKIFG